MNPSRFLALLLAGIPAVFFAQTVEVTSTGAGFGTSSPQALVDVQGTAIFRASGGQELFRMVWDGGNTGGIASPSGRGLYLSGGSGTASAQGISIDGAGKVGIGTSTPSNDLTVLQKTDSQSTGGVRVYRANGTSSAAFFQGGDDNTYLFNWGGGFKFYTNGAVDALTISSSGNVGIGTTSPGNKLTVVDNLSAGSFGFAVLGSSGAARDILIAGQSGYSNGFVVQYTGSAMNYSFSDGNVGIGTTSPSYKLEVSGSVRATSFISNSTTYADFVFKPGYKLASLPEVEATINAQGHLPGIPSEAEAKANGINLAEMQTKLLQKVEELTLHLIAHEKELQLLREENKSLGHENASLHHRVSELEKR